MKRLALLSAMALSLIVGCSNSNNNTQKKSGQDKDTCFYTLEVPANIDLPETPHFDTTIVRSANCAVHILVLQSWGTETSYTLSTFMRNKHAHFFTGEKGSMDISGLSSGAYEMNLIACGNGGTFTLRIK
ncbi:MAG TPA: hypothetical protein VNB90_07575 [Cytophagaceae bacterium]|nr:hypothetical protein [Cytophagaceae bacterium]